MFDKPTNHGAEPIDPSGDFYRELAEYLQGPVYQVFERWHGEQPGSAEPPLRMFVRPWCGRKIPPAFDFVLTAADSRFLSELGIRA